MIGTAYAAAAEHAASGSGIPQFQSDFFSSQSVWAVVSFFVLLYLLNKYVIPAIGNVLDARSKQIADDLGQAERMRLEAESALANYRKELSYANEVAAKIVEEARLDAKRQRDTLLAQLDETLNKKRENATNEIELSKRKALAEIKGLAVEISMMATEKLIAQSVSQTTADQMVDDVIHQVQNKGLNLH